MRRAAGRAAAWLVRASLPAQTADIVLGDLFEELHDAGGTRAAHWRFLLRSCAISAWYFVRRPFRRSPRNAAHPNLRRRAVDFDGLKHDVTFSFRAIAKRPSFPAIVLTTLALGIGASTAIFSVLEAVLIRPLPFADPQQLVFLGETNNRRMGLAWPNYLDYRDRMKSFEAFACHQPNPFTVTGIGKPRRVDGGLVCSAFFDVLGVRPQLGRTFVSDDDRAGATPVAIVSHGFWQQFLGGDRAVLGRTIRMDEKAFTVVGVLPPGFWFGRSEEIYAPIGPVLTPESGWLDRGNHFRLRGVGRLRAGIPLEQARAEADAIAADLRSAYPATNSGNGAEVSRLSDAFVEQVQGTIVALMGAVGFLLLLACVNVANLLVARGATRQHELAIRAALGGSRWRIVRQLLSESLLLSMAGGALGIAVAFALLRALIAVAPPGIPRIDTVALNSRSLLFALGAAGLCGLVFGAFPALQASGGGGQELLAGAARTRVAPRRTRRALMVVEVALALILLAGCGLMARTMMRLNAVDPGFRADHLLTARVSLSGNRWDSADSRRAFLGALAENVRRVPGVTNAALTLSLPIEGSNWGSIFIVGDKPVPRREDLPRAAFIPVSEGYFETAGMRHLRGRTFDARDVKGSQPVTVINESLARSLWPGEDPIGKRLKQGWPEQPSPWREVVGLVADVKLEGVDQETPMQAYLPIMHDPSRSVAIVARTSGDPGTAAASVEDAVLAIDKDLPVTRVMPMTEMMRAAIARQRFSMIVLALFAIVAVTLAAVGLYGIIAHAVTERTREIGVRMALGANGAQVVRFFLLHGLATAAAGTAIGVGGALVLSRGLRSLLFEVQPTDPATLVGVSVVLLGVAMIACYLPARRATRVDPLLALRDS